MMSSATEIYLIPVRGGATKSNSNNQEIGCNVDFYSLDTISCESLCTRRSTSYSYNPDWPLLPVRMSRTRIHALGKEL